MYFTQEDYKKIENWLHRNSVKDTEFQEALPFTGTELVTVVQDGHNRKVNIQEFINQLYKHGVEDFLNVTNTYGANNITLKEAIRLIPAEARKEGQVITFLNTDGNWEIYQFIGKLNQWNNPTLWNNPFDWEKLVVDSILPDEEDLTKSAPDAKGNAYLSLKDRKYEPDKYSGLGRKILRRRVVEIEDPIYGTQEKNLLLQADFAEDNTVYVVRYDFTLNGQDITLPDNSYIEYEGGSISDGNIIDSAGGLSRIVLKKNIVNGKNILTQEMINKPNTIYEIRYDFNLNGEEITIPEGCVLDFNGGSISGSHTLTGSNTGIQAGLVKIFSTDVTLAGTWNVVEAYPEWFGAKGDAITDDRLALQKTFDSFISIILQDKHYYIASYTDTINTICLNLPTKRVLKGVAHPIEGQNTCVLDVSTDITPSIVLKLNTETTVERIGIDCNLTDLLGNEVKTTAFGTGSSFQSKLVVKNCVALYCYYGYNFVTYKSVIEGNYAAGTAIGFFIHGETNPTTDAPVSSGSYGTSVFYNNNYADYCHLIGHKFAALVYSLFSANAADHCGYTGNTITTGGASYYCTFLRECCFKANGSETSFLCLKVSSVQRCSFENMCFFINSNVDSIYGEDNKPFIELINNNECIFKTFEVSGSWTNKKGRIRIYSDYPNNGQIIENININGGVEQTILNLGGYASAGNDNTQRSGIATFVPKAGPTTVRTTIPIGNNINAGITFYDRTLNKLLVSNMGSWVDATGTPV